MDRRDFLTSGAALDVAEIDGASNNSVDQVRELRDNVRYMPAHSPYKIYIIDEVHMLSLAAFNALRNGAELIALLGGALMVSLAGPRLTVMIVVLVPVVIWLMGQPEQRIAAAVSGASTCPSPVPVSPATWTWAPRRLACAWESSSSFIWREAFARSTVPLISAAIPVPEPPPFTATITPGLVPWKSSLQTHWPFGRFTTSVTSALERAPIHSGSPPPAW